jgi:hypothetical protein
VSRVSGVRDLEVGLGLGPDLGSAWWRGSVRDCEFVVTL